MKRGLFLSIEGIDGAGKGTLIAALADYVRSAGIDLVITGEPGGTPVGKHIRALLLDPASGGMAVETEALLMFAARAQHVQDVIEPALAAGKWVLSDRYTDASYAYQGFGRGMSTERLAALELIATSGLAPDLTFLLEIPFELGQSRVDSRGDRDRFERESREFYEQVRAGYQWRLESEPERIIPLDATQPAEHVARHARLIVERLLQRHKSELPTPT